MAGDVAEWARGVIFSSHEEQAQLCHRHFISDSGTGLSNNYVPDASGSAKAQPLRYLPRRATFCLLDFQNAALTFLWVSADHHMRHAHEPRPLTKQLLIVKLLHRGEGTAPQEGCGLHNLRSVASSSHLISKAASRRDASRSFRNHSRLIRG
jgi:hypothetical protein